MENPSEDVLESLETTVLCDGLAFPESPRWRDGKLWLSDMHDHRVLTVDLSGKVCTVVEVVGQPSGIGWFPNGNLRVVSMKERCLLSCEPGGSVMAIDFEQDASHHWNDMVIDQYGRAYIGNMSYDFFDPRRVSGFDQILLVDTDEKITIAAEKMDLPNGSVITPDGGTLIVAESGSACISAFDILADGNLGNRRIWTQFEDGVIADGICLDSEGAVWAALPAKNGQVVRIREGGEVTHRVKVTTRPFACMLGGPDRRILFVMTAATANPAESQTQKSGRVEFVPVDVAGAGLP